MPDSNEHHELTREEKKTLYEVTKKFEAMKPSSKVLSTFAILQLVAKDFDADAALPVILTMQANTVDCVIYFQLQEGMDESPPIKALKELAEALKEHKACCLVESIGAFYNGEEDEHA